jgi:hypothetical protein
LKVMPHFSGDNRPRIESFEWCTENLELLTEKRTCAAKKKKGKAKVPRPKKGKEASF